MHQVLRMGDRGAEITELQQYLASLGYAEVAMAAPGVFDDVTEQVVRQFQRDYGLSETGEYDEDTWRTMVALPVAAPPPDSSPDGQPSVAATPADPAGSYRVPDMLQPNDLTPLEDARGVTEREFQPQGGVAVRVDPTFCVFWGFAVGSTELLADHRPLLGEIAVAHAREVGDYAPGGRVTLDIRMPPETPDDAIQDLLDTIRGEVGHPRLEVLVSRWP